MLIKNFYYRLLSIFLILVIITGNLSIINAESIYEDHELHSHDEDHELHSHDEEHELHSHDEEHELHSHDEEHELHSHDEDHELYSHDDNALLYDLESNFKVVVSSDGAEISDLKDAEGKEINAELISVDKLENVILIITLHDRSDSILHMNTAYSSTTEKDLSVTLNIPKNTEGMRLKIFVGDANNFTPIIEPLIFENNYNVGFSESMENDLSYESKFSFENIYSNQIMNRSLMEIEFETNLTVNGSLAKNLKEAQGKMIKAEVSNLGETKNFIVHLCLYDSRGIMRDHNSSYSSGDTQTVNVDLVIPTNADGMVLKVFIWDVDTSIPFTKPLVLEYESVYEELQPPNGLISIGNTTSTINLSWDYVPNAIGYEISYNDQIIYVTNTYITLDNLLTERLYEIKVRTRNGSDTSDWSKSILISLDLLDIPLYEMSIQDLPEKPKENELDFVSNHMENTENNIKYYRVLNDFNKNPYYLLVQYEKGGYAIILRTCAQIIESSDGIGVLNPYDPYITQSEDLSYLGPFNYFRYSNGSYIDITTGKEWVNESDYLQSTHDQWLENFENKLRSEYNRLSKTKSKSSDLETTSIDSTIMDSTIVSSSVLKKIKNIPDYERDILNRPFGVNTGNADSPNGTCGPLAASILLMYYQYQNKGSFVDSSLWPQSGSKESLDKLHMKILDYTELTKSGTYPWNEDGGINTYLGSNSASQHAGYEANSIILPFFQTIADKIDSGIPVSLYASADYDNSGTSLNHVTVAYGYRIYEDTFDLGNGYKSVTINQQIRVHTGWHTGSCSCNGNLKASSHKVHDNIYLSSYLIGGIVYLDKYSNHTHNYHGKNHIYDTYHDIECVSCKLKVRSNHTYQSKIIAGDDKYHESSCQICGYISSIKTHNFNSSFNDDTTHKSVCKDCGYTQIFAHKWQYTNQSASNHTKFCSDCGKTTTLAHTMGGYTNSGTSGHYKKCIYCSYVTPTEAHGYLYTSNGASGHKKSCGSCAYTIASESHNMQSGKCNLCPYVDTSTHTHNYVYTSNGSSSHKKYCSICNLVIDSAEAHALSFMQNGTSGHYKKCIYCSYTTSTEAHGYLYTSNGSSGHREYCGSCNYTISASKSHRMDWVQNGVSGHSTQCKDCTYKTSNTAHGSMYASLGSSGHREYCGSCNYTISASKSHRMDWVQNGMSGHSTQCKDCTYKTSNTAHGSMYASLGSSGHRKYCGSCNYTISASEAHSFNSSGKCNLCSYKKGAYSLDIQDESILELMDPNDYNPDGEYYIEPVLELMDPNDYNPDGEYYIEPVLELMDPNDYNPD